MLEFLVSQTLSWRDRAVVYRRAGIGIDWTVWTTGVPEAVWVLPA